MIEEYFHLDKICSIISRNKFKRVVLQFPDDLLHLSTTTYSTIRSILLKESNDLELFIAADSTYGSSVDDVSAQHVESDLLIYFGDDLSSSGAMPGNFYETYYVFPLLRLLIMILLHL